MSNRTKCYRNHEETTGNTLVGVAREQIPLEELLEHLLVAAWAMPPRCVRLGLIGSFLQASKLNNPIHIRKIDTAFHS